MLPVAACAWGPIGHMTVGYVAYQNLTPAAKARVIELLKLNPSMPTGTRPFLPGHRLPTMT